MNIAATNLFRYIYIPDIRLRYRLDICSFCIIPVNSRYLCLIDLDGIIDRFELSIDVSESVCKVRGVNKVSTYRLPFSFAHLGSLHWTLAQIRCNMCCNSIEGGGLETPCITDL
jgi:hypothetical protein